MIKESLPSTGRRGRRRPRRGRSGWGWRRIADLALAVLLLAALAFAAAHAPRLWPIEMLSGAVRVADGDSLVMDGVRIRLEGIDAPEMAQSCLRDGVAYACGRDAREALARLVAGHAVSCESRRRDRYDRVLAVCAAGGTELNRAMVDAGWALAYGGYGDAEAAARQAGRGLWAGSFERPQEWRRVHGGLVEDGLGEGRGWLSPFAGWLRRLFGV